jgi:hypothetical protein
LTQIPKTVICNNWRESIFRSKRWVRGQKQEDKARVTKVGQNKDLSKAEDKNEDLSKAEDKNEDRGRDRDGDKYWGEDIEISKVFIQVR